ncbi:MAG: SGNH/GDSL hydrolase family protein [Clostridia bacterium]|nr:SGNH/GDSL hydrolase family protein [Clostridia bacterium]
MDISKIDKNFKVETKLNKRDIVFYDIKSEPFSVYGVFYENGKFRRMKEDVAKSVSEGVYWLHSNTAGGRVKFKTDSKYIAIHTKMSHIGKMSHFALTGSSGFDLYISEKYYASFVPPFELNDGYEGVIEFGSKKMREITINFPLYSDVNELYIGVGKNAKIEKAECYKIDKPIVYYGSSITQGGCASRPGNAYEAIISQRLGVDHINLGFSGNARAEKEISHYICSLDMSAFVYDYDHNAPTTQHLESTHERMFKEIRKAKMNLPIIIMSRPKYNLTKDEKIRREIIKRTYENARDNGDKNVYFIDGKTLMKICHDEGTVDSCHPNDLGFYSMAMAIIKVLKNEVKL